MTKPVVNCCLSMRLPHASGNTQFISCLNGISALVSNQTTKLKNVCFLAHTRLQTYGSHKFECQKICPGSEIKMLC